MEQADHFRHRRHTVKVGSVLEGGVIPVEVTDPTVKVGVVVADWVSVLIIVTSASCIPSAGAWNVTYVCDGQFPHMDPV